MLCDNDEGDLERAPSLSGTIEAIKMQGDKILVGGTNGWGYEQSDKGFLSRVNSERYLPDGRLDKSFGQGGMVRKRVAASDYGGVVAVMPDGRIVVSGISSHRGPIGPWGKNRFLTLLRYRPSDRLDPFFFGDGIFTRAYRRSWSGAFSWDPTIGRRGRILVTGGGTALRFRPVSTAR